MYGGERSPVQKATDTHLVDKLVLTYGSKQKAIAQKLKIGWSYIYRKNPDKAIKHLNQAWLINNEAYKVFWGFGEAAFLKNDFNSSVNFYEIALNKSKMKDVILLRDAGVLYSNFNMSKKALEVLSLAKSQALKKDKESVYSAFTVYYLKQKDCPSLFKYIKLSKSFGGKTLDKRLVRDATTFCPAQKL
jgi:tetratricopeptide (TPR) repeat protein